MKRHGAAVTRFQSGFSVAVVVVESRQSGEVDLAAAAVREHLRGAARDGGQAVQINIPSILSLDMNGADKRAAGQRRQVRKVEKAAGAVGAQERPGMRVTQVTGRRRKGQCHAV
ncbi:MAG: hypothetical protein L0Y71_22540, partial [Gemmataceae bacterium]|nr:hypothetical protein [Gemmataceae bacterium]